MYHHKHTTQDLIYQILMPIFIIIGLAYAPRGYSVWVDSGFKMSLIMPFVIPSIFFLIGIYLIFRLIWPQKWWCEVTSEILRWGTNGHSDGECAAKDIRSIEICYVGENNYVLLHHWEGTEVTINNPEMYFGSLSRFGEELKTHGYKVDI